MPRKYSDAEISAATELAATNWRAAGAALPEAEQDAFFEDEDINEAFLEKAYITLYGA